MQGKKCTPRENPGYAAWTVTNVQCGVSVTALLTPTCCKMVFPEEKRAAPPRSKGYNVPPTFEACGL